PDDLAEAVNAAIHLDRLDETIVWARRGTRLYPDHAVLHYYLAWALLKDYEGRNLTPGNRAVAVRSILEPLRRAIESRTIGDGDRGRSYLLRSRVYLILGEPGPAVADARRATAILTDEARAFDQLAAAHELAGDLEAARAALRIAIEIDPDDAWAREVRARIDAAAPPKAREPALF